MQKLGAGRPSQPTSSAVLDQASVPPAARVRCTAPQGSSFREGLRESTLSCPNHHPTEIRHRVGHVPRCARVSPRSPPALVAWPALPGLRKRQQLRRGPGPPAEKELTGRGEVEPEEEGNLCPSESFSRPLLFSLQR